MPVRVQCPNPNCGESYKADDSYVGRTIVCKHCGQEFTVSASGRKTCQPDAEDGTGAARMLATSAGDAPEKIGRFEIRSRLGSGAFGTVYRAHDPVLDREVALKVPRAAALQKPKARARFLREPKAAAQLRHPNIVPVYEASIHGDRYYIASAYIEGRTLEEVIAEKHLDFRRVAEIVRDLANALHYAHRMGVVHRDVKPANIMIDAQGQPLLMDFGLARLVSSDEKLTQEGVLMGTPAYMAPEQADRSFGEVGPTSDQYSLGVVLYELLCGQPPFRGPTATLVFNTVHQEPPALRTVNPEIPRDLETICRKAMAKSAHRRYSDCDALARDLRRWLADRPIRARRIGLWERLWGWSRRNPAVSVLLLTVGLLLCVLVGVVGTVFWGRNPSGAHERTQDLQAAIAEEEERKGQFTQLLEEAREAGVEHPTWVSLRPALENLEEAEALAASDAERVEVKELRFQVQQTELDMQQTVDNKFRSDLAKFTERFDEVMAAPELRAGNQLIKEGILLQRQEYVSERLRSDVNWLISRLIAMQDALLENLDEAALIRRITQAIGDEDAFQSELEIYAKVLPDKRRAADFDRVARQEVALWKGFAQWEQLIGDRLNRDLTQLRPEDAKPLSAQIARLREQCKFLPAPESLEPVQLFVDAVAKRVDERGNRIHLSLTGVECFDNRTLVDLFMVKDRTGKKYYFNREPHDTIARWSFYCFTGFDLQDTKRVLLSHNEIANQKNPDGSPDWTAPQAVFAKYALDQLARLNDGNWVSTFGDLLAKLHADQEIEPILKVQLMQLVLDVACEGSYCLKQALEKQHEVLETAPLDLGANWIDPDDSEGRKASKMAQQVLYRIGDLDDALNKASQLLESFKKPAFEVRDVQWVGWLMREPGRQWTCVAQEGVLDKLSGDAVVLHVASKDTPAEFRWIGRFRGGQFQVGYQADPGLAEGRAVFAGRPLSP